MRERGAGAEGWTARPGRGAVPPRPQRAGPALPLPPVLLGSSARQKQKTERKEPCQNTRLPCARSPPGRGKPTASHLGPLVFPPPRPTCVSLTWAHPCFPHPGPATASSPSCFALCTRFQFHLLNIIHRQLFHPYSFNFDAFP